MFYVQSWKKIGKDGIKKILRSPHQMKIPAGKFQSDHQSFLQLGSIQSASIGIVSINVGQQLAQQYGAGTAICSIILGNLILWLAAVAIISMTNRHHSNAIENIKGYLGRFGGILSALILIGALMSWYSMQINYTVNAMAGLFQWDTNSMLRLGAGLGLFSALLAIGGIRLLRRLTVFFLPLLFGFVLYSLFTSDKSVPLQGTWGLSVTAVVTTILISLSGVINFPTFFRHSRSRPHSFLALTFLTILISFFEISTIWVDFSPRIGGVGSVHLLAMTLFLILSILFCNLLNIYMASASWEAIIPHFSEGKEYAIIGLFGTLTYTFIQISTPVQFFQDLTSAYLAILGVVLLLAYLMRIIVKHRPRPYERRINLLAWLFGCIVATVYEIHHFPESMSAVLAGVNASILFFLGILFIEETTWAVRKKILLSMK